MAREKMSPVDHAWLRMDGESNLMVIVGITVFARPVSLQRLHRLLEERLLRHRRFRQRVEVQGNTAWWVDDEAFDLSAHCFELNLPGPQDQIDDAQLQDHVGDLAMERLDPDRPLWQMQLVQNYRGTSALITRIHHCIADGIALVAVMMSLTDDAGGGRPAVAKAKALDKGAARAVGPVGNAGPARFSEGDRGALGEIESNPWTPYLTPVTMGTIRAIEVTEQAMEKSMQASMHALATPELFTDAAGAGQQAVRDVLSLLLMPNDSPTSLKGKPGDYKRVAWNDPLPIEEVKLVGKVLGCSINDVLLSCVSGAIGQYLRGRGERVRDVEIRAMVPVNLRPVDEALRLGNKFGLVPLVLPVGIANPLERLLEVRRRMDALKVGYQALMAYAILGIVGVAPKLIQDKVLRLFADKSTAVMTNVPGPAQPLHMAGEKVERIMFWVPQSGDIGMGVSILSYAGGVQFGLITDSGLCPQPQRIVEGFAPEFEKLLLTVMMMPREPLLSGHWTPAEVERRLFKEMAT